MNKHNWWEEQAGFFGSFYYKGDHSLEGHLANVDRLLPERTIKEVEGINTLINIKSPLKILDAPCGYGRHAIALAAEGHEVTGLDLNKALLQIAESECSSLGVNVTFERTNMIDINFSTDFDLVLNMFYSFGFFETDEENLLLLKKFHDALKPNGKLLMHTDVNIPRIIAGDYKLHEERNLSNGGTLTIDEMFNEQSKRIEGTWTIVDKNKSLTKPYSVRVYETSEFIDMCSLVGFETCKVFGDWEGRKYNKSSEEIIFVASKTK